MAEPETIPGTPFNEADCLQNELPDDEVLYELAVKFRREGKAMLYSLDDDHVRSMLELGMEHVEE